MTTIHLRPELVSPERGVPSIHLRPQLLRVWLSTQRLLSIEWLSIERLLSIERRLSIERLLSTKRLLSIEWRLSERLLRGDELRCLWRSLRRIGVRLPSSHRHALSSCRLCLRKTDVCGGIHRRFDHCSKIQAKKKL